MYSNMSKKTKTEEILENNAEKLESIPEDPVILPEQQREVEGRDLQVRESAFKSFLSTRWFDLKKEYLSDPEAELKKLGRKYNVTVEMVRKRIKEEGWEKQRKNLFARADSLAQQKLEQTLSEVKVRHIKIATMLQKVGIKSIKNYKIPLKHSDSLKYITEGVRIERETRGLSQDKPQIVNIISQQQAIIKKYRKKT